MPRRPRRPVPPQRPSPAEDWAVGCATLTAIIVGAVVLISVVRHFFG